MKCKDCPHRINNLCTCIKSCHYLYNTDDNGTCIWMQDDEGEEMGELERLKYAEKAEPMAVLVMPWPKNCSECRFCDIESGEGYYCMANFFQEVGWLYSHPDWCPLHPIPEKQ